MMIGFTLGAGKIGESEDVKSIKRLFDIKYRVSILNFKVLIKSTVELYLNNYMYLMKKNAKIFFGVLIKSIKLG